MLDYLALDFQSVTGFIGALTSSALVIAASTIGKGKQ